VLERTAAAHGEREALIGGDTRLTWEQTAEQSRRIAKAMHKLQQHRALLWLE